MRSGPAPQKRLLKEQDLAGEHSKFRPLKGLTVHYTVERPAAATAAAPAAGAAAAVHCYHGFGANSWSWSFAQAWSPPDKAVPMFAQAWSPPETALSLCRHTPSSCKTTAARVICVEML